MSESSNQPPLLETPLHALHRELGAKLVPFAGYQMPVQFPAGIIAEHRHTRARAGLFDVSHMGQIRLTGHDAASALERLVPIDVIGLGPQRQRYAVFTAPDGGILDDLMVINLGDHLLLVVNAARKHEDLAHLQTHLAGACTIEPMFERALLALQGPAAADVLSRLAPAAGELVFMGAEEISIQGTPCLVSRSGYTGEDGFEISVPAEEAESLARTLLDDPKVEPVGLGARDSLRLEAGLCLYGHDIDTTTTPVEAALTWALSKARRPEGERPGGYPGAEVLFDQLANGTGRRRVGILPEERAPVREGTELTDLDAEPIGRVTSGGFGPTIGAPLAMGYVAAARGAPGTPIRALVRGRARAAKVARLPFVETHYHRGSHR